MFEQEYGARVELRGTQGYSEVAARLLSGDNPSTRPSGIPYPDDTRGPRRIMPKREFKENMALCLECYAGKVGAPFGVKLEDQGLVTKDGPKLICAYPYDAKLLG